MSDIIIQNLSHCYLIENKNFFALQDVNMVLKPHKIHIILGHSGAGKTTLLRLIAELETPTKGQIQKINSRLGMIFQEPRLMPWLTVEENIKFWGDDKVSCSDLLQKMGLESFEKLYPHQLSGGMAQKTSLARALCYQPDTLLMDEPFASLDYFTRLNMQELVLKIQKQYALRIIFITHNIEEAITLGDYIYIMNKGQLMHTLSNSLSLEERKNSSVFYSLKKEILSLIE